MKSGFVVMVGRSNVGKSTLLNALIGTKLAITTPKPQTTRIPIRGILHDPRGQIVFVDTPGIFTKKLTGLTTRLNDIAKSALRDIDLILYVVDPTRAIGPEERLILRLIEPIDKPKLLAINKIDEKKPSFLDEYEDLSKKFAATINISALRHKNLRVLIDKIFEYLQEAEPFYPEMQVTDLEQRVWIEELIREKIFLALHDEVPYTTAVRVEEMEMRKRQKKQNEIFYIRASILTTSERYKRILIGSNGRQIKEIGQAARRELEGALNKSVFLDLEVVVEPNWQSGI